MVLRCASTYCLPWQCLVRSCRQPQQHRMAGCRWPSCAWCPSSMLWLVSLALLHVAFCGEKKALLQRKGNGSHRRLRPRMAGQTLRMSFVTCCTVCCSCLQNGTRSSVAHSCAAVDALARLHQHSCVALSVHAAPAGPDCVAVLTRVRWRSAPEAAAGHLPEPAGAAGGSVCLPDAQGHHPARQAAWCCASGLDVWRLPGGSCQTTCVSMLSPALQHMLPGGIDFMCGALLPRSQLAC